MDAINTDRVVEWLGTIVCYVDSGEAALGKTPEQLLQSIRESCVDAFRHLHALGVELPPAWVEEVDK